MIRTGLVMVFATALSATAVAQPAPSPPAAPPNTPPTYTKPPDTVPLPPPIPDATTDPELEPQVTIIRKETETVEEVRVNGELRYVKVTPKYGLPYYLVPSGNGQTYLRYDSLGSGVRAPMWLLFSW
ncbi:MAG: DUF2782 domain-containing protein [Casimicrobiaceae bacterium]|jgi:hypothetical protein